MKHLLPILTQRLFIIAALLVGGAKNASAYTAQEAQNALPRPGIAAAEAARPYGLSIEEFIELQSILSGAAAASPEVRQLDERIKALTIRRAEVLFAAALATHPERAGALATLRRGLLAAPIQSSAPKQTPGTQNPSLLSAPSPTITLAPLPH